METINNDTDKEAEEEPTVSADSKDYYAILGNLSKFPVIQCLLFSH